MTKPANQNLTTLEQLRASAFEEDLKLKARDVCKRLFDDIEKSIFIPIRRYEQQHGEGSLPEMLERATVSIIASFVQAAVNPMAQKSFLDSVFETLKSVQRMQMMSAAGLSDPNRPN